MKDKNVLLFIMLAGLAILAGVIGKFTGTKIFIQSYTWIQVTQTLLLFGIACGIGNHIFKSNKE